MTPKMMAVVSTVLCLVARRPSDPSWSVLVDEGVGETVAADGDGELDKSGERKLDDGNGSCGVVGDESGEGKLEAEEEIADTPGETVAVDRSDESGERKLDDGNESCGVVGDESGEGKLEAEAEIAGAAGGPVVP
jgi:hypothetical protein